MLTYPHFNPIALSIGPLHVRWYGLMYVLGFLIAWALALTRVKRMRDPLTSTQVSDLLCYAMLGGIIGGRVGYMLIYNWDGLITDPLSLIRVWEGGMSIHGGIVGALLGIIIYSRRIHRAVFELTDFVAPLLPPGLGLGRLGNFINGELWGRSTEMPWGMVFPHAGTLPRHPSQLYEAFLEGIVLFSVMWIYSAKPRPRMAVSGMLMLGYGTVRCFAEMFREPDAQVGFLLNGHLTMGQLLSLPMILFGIVLLNYETISRFFTTHLSARR